MEAIRQRLQAEGFHSEVAGFAVDSRRKSTITTYDSRLEKFHTWAATHAFDPLDATVQHGTTFLVHLFSEGKQASTIKIYRSAIASVHKGFADGSTVGDNLLSVRSYEDSSTDAHRPRD